MHDLFQEKLHSIPKEWQYPSEFGASFADIFNDKKSTSADDERALPISGKTRNPNDDLGGELLQDKFYPLPDRIRDTGSYIPKTGASFADIFEASPLDSLVRENHVHANEMSVIKRTRPERIGENDSKRIAKESAQDDRASRLARKRKTTAKRRANESTRDRELRLQREKEYHAKKKANETPEARALRLDRQREYEREKRATESAETRDLRLEKTHQKRASESLEDRELRLERRREYEAKRMANESTESANAGKEKKNDERKRKKSSDETAKARDLRLEKKKKDNAKRGLTSRLELVIDRNDGEEETTL